MNMKFFYKKHEINSIIPDEDEEIMDITEATDNIMLEYASSNAKALLNILSNNLIANNDKELINEVLDEFASVSDNYNNVVNNLDMIFLSTELLRVDHKLGHIPKSVERKIVKKKPLAKYSKIFLMSNRLTLNKKKRYELDKKYNFNLNTLTKDDHNNIKEISEQLFTEEFFLLN